MFNIKWDADTNGVILTSDEGDVKYPVRPVFFEELDLLHFEDHGFTYPRVEEPILWAAGRAYYYRGEKIAIARGGGFYEEVNLEVFSEPGYLEPVDVAAVLKKNQKKIYFYSHDAIDFIRSTVEKYKDKVDIVTVSFSGGKDSIVVADLVKRSLDCESYSVIFADTQMEAPSTYATIKNYIHDNPKIKFYTAEYDSTPLEYWNNIGSPSRTIRWCHTIFKTSNSMKTIKKILGKDNPSVLTFEGVRAEESPKRSKYSPINEGTGCMKQTNARPILHWGSAEVFLYILLRELPLNQAYREGHTRVGCVMCPYSTGWSEYLYYKTSPDIVLPYISLIKENAKDSGVSDINSYVSKGEWKKRSGAKYLNIDSEKMSINVNGSEITIILKNPSTDIREWLRTAFNVTIGKYSCAFNYQDSSYKVIEKRHQETEQIRIYGDYKLDLVNIVKRISNKSAYCLFCGACESVCPTGALKISNRIIFNEMKCIHCLNCINHVEKGCWVAFSVADSSGGKKSVKNVGSLDRYSGFGMRKKWVALFLERGREIEDSWLKDSLGLKQVPAMRHWLEDSYLWIKKEKKASKLGEIFIGLNRPDDLFMWSVIWHNLGEEQNSSLVHWYMLEVEPGQYTKKDLIEKLAHYVGKIEPKRTETNAINALINLFENSPIGDELCAGDPIKHGSKKSYIRSSSERIPDLAVLYSVYRYAERNDRRRLVASEFIKNNEVSPHTAFCMDYSTIKSALTRLATRYPDLLYIEFSGNLDNIILSDSHSSLDVVKRYLEEQ